MPKRRTTPTPHASTPSPSTHDDMMRDLTRLLERQQFGSIDEANAFLAREVMGKPLPHIEPANAQERAEDLVTAAREEASLPKLRKRVAEALALDADCVAAHLLLAEVADSPAQAMAHARDAVAAGERTLADVFADQELSLWHHPVGRQYMQAQSLLANVHWDMGDRQLAMEVARTVLRLNPGDNQGIRYVLLDWLLRAGSVAEIDALLGAYDDAAAAWKFGAALHAYRTLGPAAKATNALRAALIANPHVAPMLLGEVQMPEQLPDYYGFGDENEAVMCVHASASAWYDSVGALEWLAECASRTRTKPKGRPKR